MVSFLINVNGILCFSLIDDKIETINKEIDNCKTLLMRAKVKHYLK